MEFKLGFFGKKEKKEAKALTPQDEIKAEISKQVRNYMTIWRASQLGKAKIVEQLLEEGVKTDEPDSEIGDTPLIFACKSGQLRAAQLLVQRGKANPATQGYGGLMPLHHASKSEYLELISFLIDEAKAPIQGQDDAGNTALSYAARNGHLKVVELLLAKGASIEHANKQLSTPFMGAVLNGKTAVVDYLSRRGANINAADANGMTALHIAAKCGYQDLVRLLLETKGIKPVMETREHKRPEDVAFNESIRDMIRIFVQTGSLIAYDQKVEAERREKERADKERQALNKLPRKERSQHATPAATPRKLEEKGEKSKAKTSEQESKHELKQEQQQKYAADTSRPVSAKSRPVSAKSRPVSARSTKNEESTPVPKTEASAPIAVPSGIEQAASVIEHGLEEQRPFAEREAAAEQQHQNPMPDSATPGSVESASSTEAVMPGTEHAIAADPASRSRPGSAAPRPQDVPAESDTRTAEKSRPAEESAIEDDTTDDF